jgi:hypothetical protein
MAKKMEKDRKPAEDKLADEELEQAAGGQIEIVQDGPVKAAGIRPNPNDGFRGGHFA